MSSDFLASLPERVGWTLLHSLWQFACIAAGLLLLGILLRTGKPTLRYAAECLALAAMMASAAITFCCVQVEPQPGPVTPVPLTSQAFPPAPSFDQRDTTESLSHAPLAFDGPNGELGQTGSLAREAPRFSVEPPSPRNSNRLPVARWQQSTAAFARAWLSELCLGWLVGISLLSFRPIIGFRCSLRLRQRGTATVTAEVEELCNRLAGQLHISRAIRTLQSSLVGVPTLIGWAHPVILLPASVVTGLRTEQLHAILAHELAHVRRHDALVNALQVLLETIFFYHPALWWVSRRIRITREECCDDVAVGLSGDRAGYARVLVWLDEHRGDRAETPYALAASGGSLLARVRRILRPESASNSTGSLVLATLAILMVASCGLWARALAKSGSGAQSSVGATPSITPGPATFADMVSRQFATALRGQDLPYMDPQHIDALAEELRAYLSERLTKEVEARHQATATAAIKQWAQGTSPSSQGYLNFRERFDMLCWQLWIFSMREELLPDQMTQRVSQRTWIRDYIRQLPAPANTVEDWQHAGRLKLLEESVFDNPLSPYFYDPMSDELFQDFKRRLTERQRSLGRQRLIHAPAHVFAAAAQARTAELLERYPPGFPSGGLSLANTTSFGFRASAFPNDARHWLPSGSEAESKRYYDAERNRTVDVPGDVDSSARSDWLAAEGADLHFDGRRGELQALRGARLALLEETEWYNLDRLSNASLKQQVEIQALEVFPIGLPSSPEHLRRIQDSLESLPTGVLLTTGGELVLFRVEQLEFGSTYLFFRPRPLAAYPPFHAGSVSLDQTPQVPQESPMEQRPLPGHHVQQTGSIHSLRFAEDGSTLHGVVYGRGPAQEGRYAHLQSWDLRTLQATRHTPLEWHSEWTQKADSLTLSEDSQYVFGSLGNRLGVWNAQTGKLLRRLDPQWAGFGQMTLRHIASSKQANIVACSGLTNRLGLLHDGYLFVWNIDTGALLRSIASPHTGTIQSMALSHDGARIAAWPAKGGVGLWEVASGEQSLAFVNDNPPDSAPFPENIPGALDQVLGMQFSHDGTTLAISDLVGVKLLDTVSQRVRQEFTAPFRFNFPELVFSPDDHRLLRFGVRLESSRESLLWDLPSGALQSTLEFEGTAAAFSPDSKWLAMGHQGDESNLVVWQLPTGFGE